MEKLFLEDLRNMNEEQIKEHLKEEYLVREEELTKYEILVAYESVGSWGCDSDSFFLLREKSTGKLYENHASHCSCYGFEDQFEPEETTIEYLKSGNFYFSCGGYDSNEGYNQKAVKDWILNNL